MAATGTLSITGTITGLLSGAKTFLATVLNANASGQVTDVVLQSGDNTIAVPSGAVCCVISMPSNNAAVIKLKGAGGDTGVILHLTNPMVLSFGSGQTSFILNASVTTASAMECSFL